MHYCLYDYGENKLIGPLTVPKNLYVSDAALTPSGDIAIFVVCRLDDSLAGITTYNFTKKKWERIKLKL